MSNPKIDANVYNDMRCRFGCKHPVAAIVWVPEGCWCWSDPVQALCLQHLNTAQSTGDIEILVSFFA